MPSIIYTASRLNNSYGLALLSHSITEQTNGLYLVSCEYATRSSNVATSDALFSLDLQPPIYPAGINVQQLLGGGLFMISREVTTEMGISYIKASYASGITRGNRSAYVTTERESPITKTIVLALDKDGRTTAFVSFSYSAIVMTHEYVAVGNDTSSTFLAPNATDLYTLLNAVGGGQGVRPYNYAIQFLNTARREETATVEQVTPSVAVKQTRFFIEDVNTGAL
jgi:hypothetical protein